MHPRTDADSLPLADLVSLYWRTARVQRRAQPATDRETRTHTPIVVEPDVAALLVDEK